MAKEKMTGFMFQDSYLKRTEKLSDAEFGQLVRALSLYHRDGVEVDLEGRVAGSYDFIRADMEEIDQRYATKCENNRRTRTQANDDDRERTLTIADDREQIKDKIKENKKDIDDDATAHARETSFGTVNADPVIVAVQAELTGLTVSHYDDLAAFRQDLPDELVIEAINEAVAHGARTWAYVRSILQGYIKDGVKTVGQARERSDKRKREGPSSKRVSAQRYEQRNYSENELEGMVYDL